MYAMPDYTSKLLILFWYLENANNYRQAAVLYCNRFLHRRHPNHCMISRLVLRQWQRQKRQRRRINISEKDDLTLLAVLGMSY